MDEGGRVGEGCGAGDGVEIGEVVVAAVPPPPPHPPDTAKSGNKLNSSLALNISLAY